MTLPDPGPDDRLDSYDYHLPEEAIAQHPAQRRDGSRLAVLDRGTGEVSWSSFERLVEHLPPGCLLVANNSRVFPARLAGRKASGGQVEFLLLTPLPLLLAGREALGTGWSAEVEGLVRASRAPRPGETLSLDGGLSLEILERGEFGRVRARLAWSGDLSATLEACGRLPLPPYIARQVEAEDLCRYQTVYAREDKAGSVAAPTAGLHFTPEIRKALQGRGVEWTEVTLYVGYGTFSPVRAANIRNHVMHSEHLEITEQAATAVAKARRELRPVIAVGTTAARVLEGVVRARGRVAAHAGPTDIFISPGYAFQAVDGLITNFHLPKSSLLMLVSALAGRERMLAVYREALARGFRFFSYGDAMLIL